MSTKHLLIKGTVQGVFFRATAKKIADELGITGWVKNTAEGDVEAVVSGTEEQLKKFISWCREGPALAKVSEVIATELEDCKFDNFLVKR